MHAMQSSLSVPSSKHSSGDCRQQEDNVRTAIYGRHSESNGHIPRQMTQAIQRVVCEREGAEEFLKEDDGGREMERLDEREHRVDIFGR